MASNWITPMEIGRNSPLPSMFFLGSLLNSFGAALHRLGMKSAIAPGRLDALSTPGQGLESNLTAQDLIPPCFPEKSRIDNKIRLGIEIYRIYSKENLWDNSPAQKVDYAKHNSL